MVTITDHACSRTGRMHTGCPRTSYSSPLHRPVYLVITVLLIVRPLTPKVISTVVILVVRVDLVLGVIVSVEVLRYSDDQFYHSSSILGAILTVLVLVIGVPFLVARLIFAKCFPNRLFPVFNYQNANFAAIYTFQWIYISIMRACWLA